MYVEELVEKYNFNDSCVNEIRLVDCNCVLNIDLCMWKQAEYESEVDEMKEVELCFKNITEYQWDSPKELCDIDYDTIIEIKTQNSHVKIIMLDEEIEVDSVVSILSFNCAEVILDC